MDRERTRLACSLLLSLLIHALLLKLIFDGQGWVHGFGFDFDWRVSAFHPPALSVVLAPPDAVARSSRMPVAESRQETPVTQSVAGGPVTTVSESQGAAPGSFAATIAPDASARADVQPRADDRAVAVAKTETEAKPGTGAGPVRPAESGPSVQSATDAGSKAIAKTGTGVRPGTHPSTVDAARGGAPAKPRRRPHRPGDTGTSSVPPPGVIALERTEEPEWNVPVIPMMPTPAFEPLPSLPGPETAVPSPQEADDRAQSGNDRDVPESAGESTDEEATRQAAAQQEAQRQEAAARQETARQEAEQQAAAQQEVQRQEAARQEAERQAAAVQEAQRQEAARQEAAQQAAAQQEAQRQEAARQEAAQQAAAQQEVQRQEAARQEAERQAAAQQEAQRQEAARQEAERQAAAAQAAQQEAARQAAAQQDAARQAAAQQEAQRQEAARRYEAQREERLRAIGRQLDEEAARREAAAKAGPRSTLPLSLSLARRVKLWGRYHANPELVRYAEAWARKIQLNTSVETVREIAKRPHTAPLVTVAIRSDGSVESVTIEVSSGVTQIDEALRRIVEGLKPYQAFEPELAREFDVIEIRRTWHFDSAVQLD